MSEAQWQKQVLDLARLTGWTVLEMPRYVQKCSHCHKPVSWSRGKATGFTDLLLVKPRHHPIFAELKTDIGKVSDDQEHWQTVLEESWGVSYRLWRPKDFDEVKRTLERVERPQVSVYPGMMSGQPCLDEHRLTCEQFADYVWTGMEDEIYKGWDYLTRDDVLVMCWFQARHGSRTWRKRWGQWLEQYGGKLWYGEGWEKVPMPPSKREAP